MALGIEEYVNKLIHCDENFSSYQALVEEGMNLSLEDIKPYLLFSDSCHARNLVFRNERFELLVFCWEPGQGTPVHDHNNSDAWIGILDGELEEQLYEQVLSGAVAPVNLVLQKTHVMKSGEVGHLNDKLGLHRVANVSDRRSISLNLYVPAVSNCRVFSSDGEILEENLSYYSMHGKIS